MIPAGGWPAFPRARKLPRRFLGRTRENAEYRLIAWSWWLVAIGPFIGGLTGYTPVPGVCVLGLIIVVLLTARTPLARALKLAPSGLVAVAIVIVIGCIVRALLGEFVWFVTSAVCVVAPLIVYATRGSPPSGGPRRH